MNDGAVELESAAAPQGAAGPEGAALEAAVPQGVAGQQSALPTSSPDPLTLRAITVKTGRMICDISIADERFRRTTPKLAAFVQGHYPDLPHHACVNHTGPTFAAVMENTSTAHLLEHLIISLQTRAVSNSAASFTGTTEWVDEAAGDARIEVSFIDDLQALRALSEATRFLNIAVITCLS